MGIKVKLRTKAISGNRLSLYLDFYPGIVHPETGLTTRREFLNRYLFSEVESIEERYLDGKGKEQKKIVPVLDKKGNNKKINLNLIDKQHNKETLYWAEQVRQKKDAYINKPEIYTGYEKEQLKIHQRGEQSFIEYFKNLINKRKGSNYDNWVSAFYYFQTFAEGNLRFIDLDEEYCENFKEYILSTPSKKNKKVSLAVNSAKSYFDKFKVALKQAYKHGYIQIDLNSKIASIGEEETHRVYLSEDELNALAEAKCENLIVKKAGLFSGLTGLRFSDIEKLTWKEVVKVNSNTYNLIFKQQKTKGAETLPISLGTYKILGEVGDGGEKVFKDLNYYECSSQNRSFSDWIERAGITKHFTFHCFRHTFAVLQLLKGTDIYTLSKMLGHRNIKTTQIYAHVVDELKNEASEKIKLRL